MESSADPRILVSFLRNQEDHPMIDGWVVDFQHSYQMTNERIRIARERIALQKAGILFSTRSKSYPQNGNKPLQDFMQPEIGCPPRPIVKRNGDFSDAHIVPVQLISCLGKDNVAFRLDVLRTQGFQRPPAVATKSIAVIGERDTENETRVGIREHADDPSPQAPLVHDRTGEMAGTRHEITCAYRIEK